MAGPAMPRAEARAGNPQISGEGGQAGDGAGGLPTVGALVHGTAAQHDHGRAGGRITAGQGGDPLRLDTGHPGGPLRSILPQMRRQLLEPLGVARHELGVVQGFGHDHVHQAQRQGGVGSGPDDEGLVGLTGRLGAADVHRDHVGPALFGGQQVAGGVGLAGQIGAPLYDHFRVPAHVLLGMDLQHPGEAHPEAPQPPTNHGRVPPLAAVKIGEAGGQLTVDAGAVVVGEDAVTAPDAHRLASHGLHFRGDGIQGFAPAHPPPVVPAPPLPHQRVQQALGIADHFARGLAPHTEKAGAVGIFRIAAHPQQFAAAHVHQHAAEGGVAAHGAHGAHGGGFGGGFAGDTGIGFAGGHGAGLRGLGCILNNRNAPRVTRSCGVCQRGNARGKIPRSPPGLAPPAHYRTAKSPSLPGGGDTSPQAPKRIGQGTNSASII